MQLLRGGVQLLRGGACSYIRNHLHPFVFFPLFTTSRPYRATHRGFSLQYTMKCEVGFRVCRPYVLTKTIQRWQDETEGGLFDG